MPIVWPNIVLELTCTERPLVSHRIFANLCDCMIWEKEHPEKIVSCTFRLWWFGSPTEKTYFMKMYRVHFICYKTGGRVAYFHCRGLRKVPQMGSIGWWLTMIKRNVRRTHSLIRKQAVAADHQFYNKEYSSVHNFTIVPPTTFSSDPHFQRGTSIYLKMTVGHHHLS